MAKDQAADKRAPAQTGGSPEDRLKAPAWYVFHGQPVYLHRVNNVLMMASYDFAAKEERRIVVVEAIARALVEMPA